MNYGLEMNKILDKCNLLKEERNAFEQFMDGKIYEDEKFYPDWYKRLPELVKDNPILDSARKKIYLCDKWHDIIVLYYQTKWEQAKNIAKKNNEL